MSLNIHPIHSEEWEKRNFQISQAVVDRRWHEAYKIAIQPSCSCCESITDVWFTTQPFMAEIHNITIELWLCRKCLAGNSR